MENTIFKIYTDREFAGMEKPIVSFYVDPKFLTTDSKEGDLATTVDGVYVSGKKIHEHGYKKFVIYEGARGEEARWDIYPSPDGTGNYYHIQDESKPV